MQTSRRRRTGGNGRGGLGPELIQNGNFSSDTIWIKGGGWTISAGAATALATAGSALAQSTTFVAGKTYRVTFSITAQTVAGEGVAFLVGGVPQSTPRIGAGTYTQDVVAQGTTIFQFNAFGAGTWEGSIDNVSVRQVGF